MRDEAPKRLRASSFKAHEYVRHVSLPASHYNKSTLTTHTTRGLTRVSYSVQACSGTRSPPRASVSFPPSHYPDACCYRKLHSGWWLRYASSSPHHKALRILTLSAVAGKVYRARVTSDPAGGLVAVKKSRMTCYASMVKNPMLRHEACAMIELRGECRAHLITQRLSSFSPPYSMLRSSEHTRSVRLGLLEVLRVYGPRATRRTRRRPAPHGRRPDPTESCCARMADGRSAYSPASILLTSLRTDRCS